MVHHVKRTVVAVCICITLSICPSFGAAPKDGREDRAIFLFGLPGTGEYEGLYEKLLTRFHTLLRFNHVEQSRFLVFTSWHDLTDVHVRRALRRRYGSAKFLPSTRLAVTRFFKSPDLARQAFDDVFIVVAGHADGRGPEARLHLAGPDLPLVKLARWCGAVRAKRLVLVVLTPQGGLWRSALKGPARALIAGNADAAFDHLPKNFLISLLDAFDRPDPGPEISLHQAFWRAADETAFWFKRNGYLATEQPVMDEEGAVARRPEAFKPGDPKTFAHTIVFQRERSLAHVHTSHHSA